MRIQILGVGFDNLSQEEAVDRALQLLQGEESRYVVTPNPEIVEICRSNPQAAAAVNGAALVLADGIGVVYGASILGTPLKGRVPGIEFAAALMEQLARQGRSLYLLGAKPGVAEKAARRLQQSYPGLRIAGTGDGYFQEDAPVTDQIRRSSADVVFVCLGAPKQELWMAKNAAATGAKLLCGLGGSLDVFAGEVSRAPQFYCDHGLEWLYRLLKEPRRIGRMMKLPLFLWHVTVSKGKKQ